MPVNRLQRALQVKNAKCRKGGVKKQHEQFREEDGEEA